MTQTKAPALQRYPGDWQRDTALRPCSLAARGLWAEMLFIMHNGEPRGVMRAGERRLDSTETIARMVGTSPDENVAGLLAELETAGVFSRDADGTIFSRRMVRDTELARKRSEAGTKGGMTTQAKLRQFSEESATRVAQPGGKMNAPAAAPAAAPKAAPESIASFADEKSRALATVRAYQGLPKDTKDEIIADLRGATTLAELQACASSARQIALRCEVEAKAAGIGASVAP